MWVIAVTVYLLQFAINTMVDNQAGAYRINNPGFFIGMSVGMILFMYAVMKIAQYPVVRELRAVETDLENQVTDDTRRVDVRKRAWRVWSIVIAIGLTALAIWGVLEALAR